MLQYVGSIIVSIASNMHVAIPLGIVTVDIISYPTANPNRRKLKKITIILCVYTTHITRSNYTIVLSALHV